MPRPFREPAVPCARPSPRPSMPATTMMARLTFICGDHGHHSYKHGDHDHHSYKKGVGSYDNDDSDDADDEAAVFANHRFPTPAEQKQAADEFGAKV